MARPTVTTASIAGNYAGSRERIIEFGNGERSQDRHKGGLIAFRNTDDGALLVEVYRVDPGVSVGWSGSRDKVRDAAPDLLAALRRLLNANRAYPENKRELIEAQDAAAAIVAKAGG